MSNPTYWISRCKRFIARSYPDRSAAYDVVELASGRTWLEPRWDITSFDDPRCGVPQFALQPTEYHNLGRWARSGRYINAFRLVLSDFEMSRVEPFATPITARREVEFHYQLPVRHTRQRAAVDAAIAVASS